MVAATQARKVSAQTTQYPTVTIVNPLSPTNSSVFDFNSNASLINSTFTAAIYISTVTNIWGWQVTLTWNNSIINYATAWIPTDNVFEPAANNGQTVIIGPPYYDDLLDQLTLGAATIRYPVNVNGEGLLCNVNFTIVAIPNATQTLSTNLEIVKVPVGGAPGSLDSYVFIYPSATETAVLTAPATLTIFGSQAITQQFILVSVIGIGFDQPTLYRGENVTITATFANNGTELETFSFILSEAFKNSSVQLVIGSMTILPNATDYYSYFWEMPRNLTLGLHTIEVMIQPLQGENTTKYNDLAVVVTIDQRPSWLEYTATLVWVMLASRLGIMFIAYVVAVICFFSVLFARERWKRRSAKIS
jgi:hypothetical protein